MSAASRALPAAARLCHALLLACYPRWIRRKYGADMRQFVVDAWVEARAHGRAGMRFHVSACWQLAVNALLAWFDTPRFLAGRSWRRADASWSEGVTGAGSRTSWPEVGLVCRQAVRSLGRAPAFTVMAVATLALGIGATTTVFGAVNGVLIAALPYPDVDRLVSLRERSPAPALRRSWVAEETFRDFQQRTRRFQSVAAWRLALVTLTSGGEPQRLQGYAVTAGYFDLMGVAMTLGRGFTPEEDRPGGPKVVVLSHALWRRRFGGDPRVVGSVVSVDRVPHTVVGVAGRRLEYPDRSECWFPLALEYWPGFRAFRYLAVVARMSPGTSFDDARQDLLRVAGDIARTAPDTNVGWSADMEPLSAEISGSLRPFLVGGLIAVAVLLLVAVANVTNLFVARMTERQEELAVRRALGAAPSRLLHLFLVEALLVAGAAGLGGLATAWWGIRVLGVAIQDWLPTADAIVVDGRVLGFAGLVTVVCGLSLGLLPALLSPRASIAPSLRGGGRQIMGRTRVHRVRTTLMTVQVALAVVLLVGAVLLFRSLRYLHGIDPGFDPRDVVTFEVQLPDGGYDDSRRVAAFDRLRAAIGAVPGVASVGTVFPMPMALGSVPFPLATPEIRHRPISERIMAHSRLVSPGYLETMRIPLRRGRTITDGDREGRPAVAVINEALARRAFGGRDPIGQRVTFSDPSARDADWRTVVGVVGNVTFRRLWNEHEPEIYVPVMQSVYGNARVVIRTENPPEHLLRDLARALHQVDPHLPMADVRRAEAIVAESLTVPRLTSVLLGLFGAIAAALALVGVVAVLSLAVTSRLREMGVRLALGAPPSRVAALVVRQGMIPVAVGMAAGLGLAVGGTRLVATQLHGVGPLDPWSFTMATLVFLLAALLVCLGPAVRAARVSAASVLRCD